MNNFTIEIIKTLGTKGDLNELSHLHLDRAINTLLRIKLMAFLDSENMTVLVLILEIRKRLYDV